MKVILRSSLAVFALSLAGSLGAQVLMVDFGPTTAAEGVLLNSPYHAANGSFTDSRWNKVQTADVAAGDLVWSNGDTAGGISLNLGQTTAPAGRTLLLSSTPSQNALGGASNTGVYADTSVGKDGLFPTSTGTRAVGFQLGGLAAGTYDIYITARNTNTAGEQFQTLYAGVTGASGDFDFSGYTSIAISYASGDAATEAWGQGTNYVKLTVSLGANQFLNVASIGGSGGSGDRGFLNSVQIVAIPESSTYALVLAGLSGGCVLLRRRRSAGHADV